jgi:hypothetical protein
MAMVHNLGVWSKAWGSGFPKTPIFIGRGNEELETISQNDRRGDDAIQ